MSMFHRFCITGFYKILIRVGQIFRDWWILENERSNFCINSEIIWLIVHICSCLLSCCRWRQFKMKILAEILHLSGFIIMHSSGQLLTLSSNFIKQGHISDTTDLCVFAVNTLEIKSLRECALYCGMNFLCNAFDFCFLGGVFSCRLRYGRAKLSNTSTQCELYEITTVSGIL